jgi:hypothetical protein
MQQHASIIATTVRSIPSISKSGPRDLVNAPNFETALIVASFSADLLLALAGAAIVGFPMDEHASDTSAPTGPVLPMVTPLHLALGLSVVGLVVMVISTCSALSVDLTKLPPPRKAPPSAETSAVLSDRFKTGYYQGQLDDDCKLYKIRRVTIDTIKGGNPYTIEYSGKQVLKPGKKLETASLRIRAVSRKLMVGEVGRGMRAPHLLLRIINRTDKFLAYRVTTVVSGKKTVKADVSHNALTLKPKQKVLRTEALLRNASSVMVKTVEVVELTRLGYHYVTRLDPLRLQFPKRTAASHNFGKLRPCKLLPWRAIRDGIKAGETSWYDVVDFYSRHSCSEYTFFRGYRWNPKGVKKLPVKPPFADSKIEK